MNSSWTNRGKNFKSKGNGLSVDEWLTCGPEESFRSYVPETSLGEALYFDAIPKAVDDYSPLSTVSSWE
jgi:lysyl-tRNA synthetase class 1